MKKISFSDKEGLNEAVLNRAKTQTRRISKECNNPRQSPFVASGVEDEHGYEVKPKYKVGEILAVAQRYCDIEKVEGWWGKSGWVYPSESRGWANKLFVRADRMPHQIRVTNVRFERLQDISDEDCIKEGIIEKVDRFRVFKRYILPTSEEEGKEIGWYLGYDTPQKAYAVLIDRVCGQGTWESNPWVEVIDFELIK